ncbi:MAG: type II toxin-antitoxin system RelE/ParE family toxin [Holdemanella biformis]|nr:type II toxin-antitoxin system RelE/ParE family toxin [Holdemanella biformis]
METLQFLILGANMASKFGSRLTKRAESDLDGIVSYITVDLANPQAASDFVDKLQDTIEEARAFPESGSLVHNEFLQIENMRKKLVGNCIKYYLLDVGENIIYILRIVYGKRNLDEILKKMEFDHVSIGHELIGAFIMSSRW